MFKKLKNKFILLSMISLLLLLTVVVTGMNLLNYISVGQEADAVLELLSHNKGHFPTFGPDRLPPNMSPELPYESRYFSVLLHENGTVLEIDTSRISAVDNENALLYVEDALEKPETEGFLGNFRFVVLDEMSGTRIIFLDCGRQLESMNRFLLTSIGMALSGYVLVSVAIIFLAGRLVRPVSESYEKQKRFITDAGHELKTPLTVIGAHVDLVEMELGEHESLTEIRNQTKRLSSLTGDLVFLAKMEESSRAVPMIDFPLSDLVEETAAPFCALARTQDKALVCTVTPLLSMRGNAKSIGQLVTILLDNALKYSPAGSTVELSLEKHGKTVLLSVTNTTVTELREEHLAHLFDRFYRTDPSRNSSTGGHGIGLSIAKAVTEAHGGKLRALSPRDRVLKITASFPC